MPMANIKQKIIRIKTNEKARIRNSKVKSRVRTFIKKAKLAIANKEESVIETIAITNKEIDKAVSKGVFKLKKGSRTKSRIMSLYNKSFNENSSTEKTNIEVKTKNVESTKEDEKKITETSTKTKVVQHYIIEKSPSNKG
jgi:small subunit ribosomal protein S20